MDTDTEELRRQARTEADAAWANAVPLVTGDKNAITLDLSRNVELQEAIKERGTAS